MLFWRKCLEVPVKVYNEQEKNKGKDYIVLIHNFEDVVSSLAEEVDVVISTLAEEADVLLYLKKDRKKKAHSSYKSSNNVSMDIITKIIIFLDKS